MAIDAPFTPTHWRVSPSLNMPKDAEQTLRLRYPMIQTATDLSKVLVSASFKIPTSSLRFEKSEDGTWLMTGQIAAKINGIDFELAPLSLLPNLRIAVSSWIGQVHTEELRARVENDVTQYLRRNGYQKASTKVSVQKDGDEVQYTAKLNIGDPCVIRGYSWPAEMPNISLPSVDVGEICNEAIASSSVEDIERRLHSRGWIQANLEFAKFDFNDQDNSALIHVRGSVGNKVVYQFVDSKTGNSVTDTLSRAQSQLLDPSVTNPDAVVYELTKELKNEGYFEASVNGPEIQHQKDVDVMVFTVNRGEVYHIGSLKFEGNEFLSDAELSNLMKIERVSSIDDSKTLPLYNPDTIRTGMDAIKANYTKEGFWDIKISDRLSSASQNDQKRMQVSITIEEGSRRVFDRIEIEGAKVIDADDLIDLWESPSDAPFDRGMVIDFQQKIRAQYANSGYFYATVSIDLRTPVETERRKPLPVTLHVKIDEGPRVRFGDIFVSGLIKTAHKVVTRELLFETGEWYDPEIVNESRRALLRLGVFSSVVITPMDPAAIEQKSDMIDLLVEVKESPSRTVSFGPGWSNYYGMRYNVEGALTNIAGTGRQVYSRASFNQERAQNAIGPRTLIGRSISGGYLEPHLLDSNIDGTVSLSQTARATDYAWALTRGGEIELSHTLRTVVAGSKIAGFYGRKLNEEEGRKEEEDAFLADTFSVGRMGIRFNLDRRDDLTWPTSGYVLTSEVSWARYELGGDLRYFRWELGNSRYFSFTDNLVFAFGFNFSAYQGVTRQNQTSGDILPASERLTAGGAESIRGFREKSLGPLVRRPNIDGAGNWNCAFTESPTGGSRRTLLKAEIRYRLTESIAATTFVDSGNTSFSREELAKFNKAFSDPVYDDKCPGVPKQRSIVDDVGYELEELPTHPGYVWTRHYTSTGLALNFLTPIGAINLAYGVPWHEPQTEKCKENQLCYPRSPQDIPLWRRGEFHFNVGAKF